MNKMQLTALSDFLREQEMGIPELVEMANYAKFYLYLPIYEAEEELPVALLYSDGEVSQNFKPMRSIKAVHLEKTDIGLEEFSIPMSYLNALQNCRQVRKRLMTEDQAIEIYQSFNKINKVLKSFGYEPLKDTRYWLETPASKTYLAKAIDFRTGKVVELKRSESCRVRPMVFL